MSHKEEVIQGVKCVVNTCHYNQDGNRCTAGNIEILPRNAASVDETDCGTFKHNESMR